MKSTSYITSILSLVSLAPASALAAGTGSSGGGKAVVCRNAAGVIESATLLDLYEARHQHGLQIVAPASNLDAELARFLENNARSTIDNPEPIGQRDIEQIKSLFRSFRFSDDKLTTLNDVGHTLVNIPTGCALEQLAIYMDRSNEIMVDQQIWEALDFQNHAALVAHEVIYRQQRIDGGDTTSEVTRRLIGMLFSTTPPPARKSLQLSGKPFCKAVDSANSRTTQFFIVSNNESSTLFFDLLNGRTTLPVEAKLPIQIDAKNLLHGYGYTTVLNPTEEFQGGVVIQSAPYEGFKVFVNYKNRQPFSIKIADPDDSVVSESIVKFCSGS
jgi:hypothetical protein